MRKITHNKETLRSKTIAVRSLNDATKQSMWKLFSRYYCSTTREKFLADLAEKQRVILLYDRDDGSLGGFSTIREFDTVVQGRTIHVLFSGDTLTDKKHWGATALQRAFLEQIVRAKLTHPFVPVYWFLISKGYRTYLLLSRNFPVYWPRYDQPTPAWELALIDKLASDLYSDSWVPELGILRHSGHSGKLRCDVAPIEGVDRAKAKDIDYFVERNPHHDEGDELCCIGLVTPSMWLYYLRRLAQKKLRAATADKTIPSVQPIFANRDLQTGMAEVELT